MTSAMRVDVYMDPHDRTFHFVYEDLTCARALRTGLVVDAPSHARLREVAICANSIAWDEGASAAKAYLDKRFAEITPS